jgi:hypothetical protein
MIPVTVATSKAMEETCNFTPKAGRIVDIAGGGRQQAII